MSWRLPLPPLLKLLLLGDLALIAAHVSTGLVLGRPPRMFDLDAEANAPAWWSSSQLLVAGLLVAIVAWRSSRARGMQWSLAALSCVLVLLSLDESAAIHERLGTFVDAGLPDRSTTFLSHTGYWPFVVGVPGALAVGYITWRSAASLSEAKGVTGAFVASFLLLFAGAVGVELLNNVEWVAVGDLFEIVEESLEMAGGSLLVWSANRLISRHPSTAQAWAALGPFR